MRLIKEIGHLFFILILVFPFCFCTNSTVSQPVTNNNVAFSVDSIKDNYEKADCDYNINKLLNVQHGIYIGV